MAVAANTTETYDNTLIREDLAQAYSMISPQSTPFMTAIGTGPALSQTHSEWSTVDLATVDHDNAVIEGDDAPGVDAATLGIRLGNYAQISDKTISTSDTSNATDAAADNIHQHAKQIVIKMQELKRDHESMMLGNVAANPGASGTARRSAGLPTFIRTNVHSETGGTDPTLSGTTTGYPNAIANVGDVPTPVLLNETNFNNTMQACWDAGGQPSLVLVNSGNKRRVSQAFSGIATQYQGVVEGVIYSAADIYVTDFGTLNIVPTHFLPTLNRSGSDDNYYVPMIDPEYWDVRYLRPLSRKPLARTGQSKKEMIDMEWMLCCKNEAASGIMRDTTNAVS